MDKNLIEKILTRMQKEAAVPPMDPAMGGMPPMDPAMAGGMPPMDPAVMGAPPMDPAMMAPPPMDPAMGGMPPMDPAMMAPPPMDPAMAGGEGAPMPVMLDINDLHAVIQESMQGVMEKIDSLEKLLSAQSGGAVPEGIPAATAPSAEEVLNEGFADETSPEELMQDEAVQKMARREENHQKWLETNRKNREESGILQKLRGMGLSSMR